MLALGLNDAFRESCCELADYHTSTLHNSETSAYQFSLALADRSGIQGLMKRFPESAVQTEEGLVF